VSFSNEFWEADYSVANVSMGKTWDDIMRNHEKILEGVKKAREEAAEDAEDIAAAREARKEPGRIPNYYLMPNCIEVKEIARYLTSNGGQAVQYIARATRTDGIIKGNPISDLEKARDMIEDEINRLKETN
jgi:hypothetical protein